MGAILGPFDAWLVQRGIRTLPLRMKRHSDSAAHLARWLQEHPQVARVYYPGLDSHPRHDLAARQSENGFDGIVAFELRDGFEAGQILMDNVQLLTLAVSLGTTDTLIEHPASMTHSILDEVELEFARISPGLVRIASGSRIWGTWSMTWNRPCHACRAANLPQGQTLIFCSWGTGYSEWVVRMRAAPGPGQRRDG